MPLDLNLSAENLQLLREKTKELESQMRLEQQKLAALEQTGEAGAGLVKVTLNGLFEAIKVSIDPVLLKESNTVIEELVAAAINDATIKTRTFTQSELFNMVKNLGIENIAGSTSGDTSK